MLIDGSTSSTIAPLTKRIVSTGLQIEETGPHRGVDLAGHPGSRKDTCIQQTETKRSSWPSYNCTYPSAHAHPLVVPDK